MCLLGGRSGGRERVEGCVVGDEWHLSVRRFRTGLVMARRDFMWQAICCSRAKKRSVLEDLKGGDFVRCCCSFALALNWEY